MDPSTFPKSTRPLNHAPYGPLVTEKLTGVNKGKVAIVTGAGKGIGRAISISLATSGANLALLDLDTARQAETEAECKKHGVEVEVFACDVANVNSIRQVFAEVEKRLGEVDILVNNAGINTGATTLNQSFEDFWKVIEVNFKGPMATIFTILPKMRSRKYPSTIITLASRAATVDVPGNMPYCASKCALPRAIGTLQLELEDEGLGEQIQNYVLHPGGVWTDMAKIEGLPHSDPNFQAIFKDPPSLCGNTCAYLATGKAKEIRGLYFDCRQDIEVVCAVGREELMRQGRYVLGMKFLDGWENEP